MFGRVVDGLEVVQQISAVAADAQGRPAERIVIKSVTIRDTPPPQPEPFSTESTQQLAGYRAVLATSSGPITIEFFPDKAPNHVRHFLQLTASGAYDNSAFHRIAPGFVIQAGDLNTRKEPLTQSRTRSCTIWRRSFPTTERARHRVDGAGRRSGGTTTSFFITSPP